MDILPADSIVENNNFLLNNWWTKSVQLGFLSPISKYLHLKKEKITVKNYGCVGFSKM